MAKKPLTVKITVSAVCLALCLVLPFITAQAQSLGKSLCLIHIGVLLCGFLCGWEFGLPVGFLAPLLRSALFGMPAFYPQAVSMAFELAVYGFLTGLFYKVFPKKTGYIYLSLILSMIGGRIVKGIANSVFIGGISFKTFLAAEFVTPVLGIVLQLLLIPPLVKKLKSEKLLPL